MLIYIFLMLGISVFSYQESKKLLAGKSKLLREVCQDPLSTKTALSALRVVCLTSAASAFLMLIPFLLSKCLGLFPTPVAVLSILCYTAGFIWAMLKLKKL